jgi:hypothetical protein
MFFSNVAERSWLPAGVDSGLLAGGPSAGMQTFFACEICRRGISVIVRVSGGGTADPRASLFEHDLEVATSIPEIS